MRYLPKSPSERQEMLAAIGARSDRGAFYSPFRKNSACASRFTFPARSPKSEIIQYFQARAAENARGYTSFLGAGVYQHLRSVVADALHPARRIPHLLHALPGGNSRRARSPPFSNFKL